MDQILAQIAPQAALFMLIATRLSAMLVVAPVFSSKMIPARIKAGLVIIISYITLPIVAAEGGTMPAGVIGFATLAVKEAIIGFAFGQIGRAHV